MRMRALSLHQPWASLIAIGRKTIETRDWWPPKDMVGQRLAIHAAKRPLHPYRIIPQGCEDMAFGALICHALVDDVRRLGGFLEDRVAAQCECHGKIGIFLSDVVRLDPPIPCRGHQGFFWVEVPDPSDPSDPSDPTDQ